MLLNLRLLGIFVVLWAAPVGALYLWRGGNDVLVDQALFFTGPPSSPSAARTRF